MEDEKRKIKTENCNIDNALNKLPENRLRILAALGLFNVNFEAIIFNMEQNMAQFLDGKITIKTEIGRIFLENVSAYEMNKKFCACCKLLTKKWERNDIKHILDFLRKEIIGIAEIRNDIIHRMNYVNYWSDSEEKVQSIKSKVNKEGFHYDIKEINEENLLILAKKSESLAKLVGLVSVYISLGEDTIYNMLEKNMKKYVRS